MESVKLVRRWGAHDAGDTVEVDEVMRDWLRANNYSEAHEGDASAGVLAPGTHGADPRAGGDVSRPGTPRFSRASRTDDEGNHVNRGGRVQGAPKPVGDVSHVAPENLGREHAEDVGKDGKASGKSSKSSSKGTGAGEDATKEPGKDEKNPRFSW